MKISIDGNIGVGKSTVLSKLCCDLRIPTFLEPVNEWTDWLDEFYKDPSRWGLSFNLKVLLSFAKWKDNHFLSLYERSPLANCYVFREIQREEGTMNLLESNLYDELYKKLAWTPDIVIYIKVDPCISMQRMKKRSRSCEDKVPLSYIEKVHEKYEQLFVRGTLENCRVIVVDGNRDFEEVYEDILNIVKSFVV
jgi:deoxyadenosine/deoxycytidine kinase